MCWTLLRLHVTRGHAHVFHSEKERTVVTVARHMDGHKSSGPLTYLTVVLGRGFPGPLMRPSPRYDVIMQIPRFIS